MSAALSKVTEALAHELRSMRADGVSVDALSRYFNLEVAKVCALIHWHHKRHKVCPPFDGDNELWRFFVRQRFTLAMQGKVAFCFPIGN